jgi:hypothetical protein
VTQRGALVRLPPCGSPVSATLVFVSKCQKKCQKLRLVPMGGVRHPAPPQRVGLNVTSYLSLTIENKAAAPGSRLDVK